jgi:lysophospholipase L1-like esterase
MTWQKKTSGQTVPAIVNDLTDSGGKLAYKGYLVDTGGGGSSATLSEPEVNQIDAYFDGTTASGQGFIIPALVYDCSTVTGYTSGGTLSVSFTPDWTGSPAQLKRVDDWVGYNNSSGLAWIDVAPITRTDGNITSGTAVTLTRTITPTSGNNYLMIVPKFIIADGNTNTQYQIKMTNIVVTLNGTEIPKKNLVSAGFVPAYVSTANAVQTTITPSDYVVPSLKTRWENKRACFYGDSISASIVGTYPSNALTYPKYVSQILNFGYYEDRTASGMAIVNASNQLQSRMNQHHLFDLITIALGVNDYNFNVPLGSLGLKGDAKSSFDRSTFYGGYRWCLDMIYESNPYAEIVMFVPITKGADTANTVGNTLEDYRTAIRNIAQLYNIPVFETRFNINQKNSVLPMKDDLHIGYVGHRRYADRLCSFLASI